MIKLKREIVATLATILFAIALIAPPQRVAAQYYTWGPDAASLKWSYLTGESGRIIYPDTVDCVARRTLYYLEHITPVSSFGWAEPAMEIPIVMHPENFASNGLVMWMPKRIEYLTTPDVDNFSQLWNKHLTAHEYRHAVQYSNLNQGVIKILSYIFGEQGAVMGLLFLPITIIEGDAVKFETSLSEYGRGLQPSFSMGYRAIGRDMLSRKNIDRWYCGSYRGYTPDHYEMGYQIVDYTYTHYGENIWQHVAEFGVRRPYYIVTSSAALSKYYGTDNEKIFHNTFNNLFDYWESLPERPNSTEIITPIDTTNFTTYSHPIPHPDRGIVALKSDYDRSDRFVAVDPESGEEERIAYTGAISTRPTMGGDRLWWSEYRHSKLYMQRVNSTLCYMDLERGRTRTVNGANNTLYPTAIGDSSTKLAYVEYAPSSSYSIVEAEVAAERKRLRNKSALHELSRLTIPQPTEIHGLAWDDKTQNLYFIATDDSGMWLGALDKESELGYRQLQRGAYITISDLRAEGGRLYYGSIESGYDELHCFDIASGEEVRVSQSSFGAFDPSTTTTTDEGEQIFATTYDKYGYHLSRQRLDDVAEVVERGSTPQNIVNPPRTEWKLLSLDTVNYTPEVAHRSREEHKSCKYNKGLKLLNIHSWLPVAFNPFDLSAEQVMDITAGATLVSQNLLSSTEAYASYGYSAKEGSVVNGAINYRGLGVDLTFSASYGGDQIVYNPFENTKISDKKHYSLTTSANLPLYFQRGYHNRYFAMWGQWNYTNGAVLDMDNGNNLWSTANGQHLFSYSNLGYLVGLHKLAFGLSYSDSVRSAYRDYQSPWSYTLAASYAMAPTNNNFADLLSLYAKGMTRGLFAHDSFSAAVCYQNSYDGIYSFSSVSLLPRGFSSTAINNNNYYATSLNYQFPICYPDGGLGSILFIRRVRLNVGFDAAQYDSYTYGRQRIYSYGGDLIIDLNPLRMPDTGVTSVKLSLYKPSRGTMSFSFGIDLPF
ncbi:MAG: hypothetical protein R3Y68_02535 [Rikenellaceae bacterium]